LNFNHLGFIGLYLEEQRKFTSLEEQYDEGEEEEYDEEEIDEDDLYDIMQQRKRSNIH
jgi:hypothetical protein